MLSRWYDHLLSAKENSGNHNLLQVKPARLKTIGDWLVIQSGGTKALELPCLVAVLCIQGTNVAVLNSMLDSFVLILLL